MNRQFRTLGLTLIELMAVVAIIALLSGIAGFFIMGNRTNNARLNLANDIETLLHTQRMRATSMNVATYVRFENFNDNSFASIVPKIGDVSICVADEDNQHDIRYTLNGGDDDENIVAIDIHADGLNRTLDSINSSKYSGDIVLLDAQVHNDNEGEPDDVNETLVICFQPNGQAYFLSDDDFLDDVRMASLRVLANNNAPEGYFIDVTGLGAIRRRADANADAP